MEDGGELSSVMVLIGMNVGEQETLLLWFPYYFSIGEVVSGSLFFFFTFSIRLLPLPQTGACHYRVTWKQKDVVYRCRSYLF